MFDNFIVTYDKKIADTFAESTWKSKKDEELRLKAINEPKESMLESVTKPLAKVSESIMTYAQDQRNLPVVIGSLIAGILVPILICCFCTGGGKKHEKKEKPEEDGEEKESSSDNEKEEKKNNEDEKEEKKKRTKKRKKKKG